MKLWRTIKWMWLTLFPPLPNCPRHGTTDHVHASGRVEGRRYLWGK